jgi:hypothetical protein
VTEISAQPTFKRKNRVPRASFVGRVIRLALLAPDIVEAILAGKQPAHLTLRDLMGAFPVEWNGQREALLNRDDG